ncbi:hypothetical protein H5410_002036 [Solanum commersonii]|uniref:Uncharacterized protein n=1 Tax=Solanum commersonii TaxID=4109 RepID=A0A9J6B1R9_SOLCO|nr:hypothetical protein H5410_002036 [Solanum commersonii]
MELMDLDLAGESSLGEKGTELPQELGGFDLKNGIQISRNIKQLPTRKWFASPPLMLQCGEWGTTKSYFNFCDDEGANAILRSSSIFLRSFQCRINRSKSFIYPSNTVINIEDPANILGGKVGELPTTYLGMPLGSKSKSKEIWSGVIEKCERKHPNRKCQYLSSVAD